MGISVADNFNYMGSKPLDSRIKYDTVADMKAASEATLYDGCLAYVTATNKYYSFNSSNTSDTTTGKWRELETGGGGTSNYEDLQNLPQINGVSLIGNKTFQDLGFFAIVTELPTPSAEWEGKKVIYMGADGNGKYTGITYECRLSPSNVLQWYAACSDILNGYFEWNDPIYFDITFSLDGTDNPLQKACLKLRTDSTPTQNEYTKVMTSGALYNAFAAKQDKLTAGTNITIENNGTINSIGATDLIYSTSERAVGKWINNWTLYQKTYQLVCPTTTTPGVIASQDYATGVSGISNVVDLSGYVYIAPNNVYRSLNLISWNGTANIFVFCNAIYDKNLNVIRIDTSMPVVSGCYAYVTIRYTK